jgi:hypothetical protein
MEEEVVVVEREAPKVERAQLADALVDLATTIDVTRDPSARDHLLQAMAALVYVLNPPKGELRDVKKLKQL